MAMSECTGRAVQSQHCYYYVFESGSLSECGNSAGIRLLMYTRYSPESSYIVFMMGNLASTVRHSINHQIIKNKFFEITQITIKTVEMMSFIVSVGVILHRIRH